MLNQADVKMLSEYVRQDIARLDMSVVMMQSQFALMRALWGDESVAGCENEIERIRNQQVDAGLLLSKLEALMQSLDSADAERILRDAQT